jgi:hypothetical protein
LWIFTVLLDWHGRGVGDILQPIVSGIIESLADLVFPSIIGDFAVCL